MKNKHLFAVALTLIFLVCNTVGCSEFSANNSPTAAAENTSAQQLYHQALSDLTSGGSFGLAITSTKKIQTGSQTLTEISEAEYTYRDYGTDSVQGTIDETISYDSHTVSISQQYADGRAYLSVGESLFTSEMTFEEYASNQIPAALLDAALYENVQAREYNGRTIIGFSQPLAAENWALPYDTQWQDASGRVILDGQGTLLQSTYTLQYTLNGKTVFWSVTSQPTASAPQEISLSAQKDSYISIQDISAPRLLEQCSGYLLSNRNISSEIINTISSQASNLSRIQTTQISLTDTPNALEASVNIYVDLADATRTDGNSTHQQKELFCDGVYTVDVGGSVSEDPGVTEDIMRSYCKNTLVSTLPLPEYIADAVVTTDGSDIVLTFSASEALAQLICASACDTLYQDPELLNALSSSYQTDTMECSLRISAATGLPVSSTVTYIGTHTIDSTVYTLTSETLQTYLFV